MTLLPSFMLVAQTNIETGFTKTVAGRKYMDAFTETKGNPVKRTCENEKFKPG